MLVKLIKVSPSLLEFSATALYFHKLCPAAGAGPFPKTTLATAVSAVGFGAIALSLTLCYPNREATLT